MNKTMGEAKSFIEEVKSQLPSTDQVDAVVCAPALFLAELQQAANGSDLKVSAQNMHFEDNGAFTGEISPAALADLGISYSVIGHSERRELFAETDETVNQKVKAAHRHNITPIVCVGETLEQREAGDTKTIVGNQVTKAFAEVSSEQAKTTVVAYEPIWAIGTGKSSTAQDANEVCAHIRQVIAKIYDDSVADAVRIQYGGSVKPATIGELMEQPDVDGALVGGASLDPASFLQLLEAGSQ